MKLRNGLLWVLAGALLVQCALNVFLVEQCRVFAGKWAEANARTLRLLAEIDQAIKESRERRHVRL